MEILAAIADYGSLVLARCILPHAATASVTTLSVLATRILPVDSTAPPTVVRSRSAAPHALVHRTHSAAPHALVHRTRRTRRRFVTKDRFSGDGDGDDGLFGSGGVGGRGWGFGFGWDGSLEWEGSESSQYSLDPAFDFVYEVICWMVLSNCTHFAFRRLGRLLAERGKVMLVRLVPSMC